MPAPLRVRFYATPAGQEPVRAWLAGLPVETRRAIGENLRVAQNTWPVGMPRVRPMRAGLYELRVSAEAGEFRVFFTASAGELVLLHGFQKKSAKTPAGDLDLARARQKEGEAK